MNKIYTLFFVLLFVINNAIGQQQNTFPTSGSVGIGTLSPVTKLDVQSTNAANFGTAIPCCASNYTISITENTQINTRIPSIQFHASGYQEAFFRLASDSRVFEIGDNQSVGVDFAIRNVANTTRNVLISGRGNTFFNGGNVGIGTINPQYPLHISGGVAMPTGWNKTAILQATFPVLLFNSNNQKWAGIGYDFSDGGMRFWVNKPNDDLNSTSPSLGILNNGNAWFSNNVGVGTATPNAPLQFASSTTNRKIVMWEGGNNDNQFYGFGVNPGVLRYQVSDGANHVFYASTSSTSSNELFRIQSNGNVGIGNSNPAYRLSVNGTLYSNKATFVGQNPGAQYTDGSVELREVNAVLNTQTSDNYAPRLTFHWGMVTSKSIALGRNGNFKFNNQNDINSYANIEVGDIISNGNMSLKGTIESRYYSVPINGGINVQKNADTTTAHLNFYDNSNGRVTAVRRLLSGEGNNGLGFYGFYNGMWANILAMKDDGKVGIGTTNPRAKLEIGGSFAQSNPFVSARSSNGNDIEFGHQNQAGYGSVLGHNSSNGSSFLAFNTEAGTAINTFRTRGLRGAVILHDVNTLALTFNQITNSNSDNQNLTERMRIDADGKVLIGTVTPYLDYKLVVAGNVIADKVKVKKSTNGVWPDFVFAPTYKLPNLAEVENFVKQNSHLPEIPSAAEIEKEGQDLGEMNRLLLKKVEELTLYIIFQEKRSIQQEERATEQEKKISQLQAQNAEIIELKKQIQEIKTLLSK